MHVTSSGNWGQRAAKTWESLGKMRWWIALATLLVLGVVANLVFSARVQHPLAASAGIAAANHSALRATNGTSMSSGGVVAKLSSAPETINVSAGGRLIIETASFNLTVAQPNLAFSKIEQLVRTEGGYVQSSQQSTDTTGQSILNMTVRVPQTNFQVLLTGAQSLGTVNQFSQTGQDVTQQHSNLEAQISELQSESQAYTRLFGKAHTMADMLQIQQSLTQANSQIADLNSQLHNLNRSIQFATLSLTLSSSTTTGAVNGASWLTAMKQSLNFMERSGLALLYLVAWVLPWTVLLAVVFLIRRWWNRWLGRKGASHR